MQNDKNTAILMIKPHALRSNDLLVDFESILYSLFKAYDLEIVRTYTKKLSSQEAKDLDIKFHMLKGLPAKTKKSVVSSLQEGPSRSLWVQGDCAYDKCREIKKLLRKSLDADQTSIYNFLHVVDWEDMGTSSKILFDKKVLRENCTREIKLGYNFLESTEVKVLGRISSIRDFGKLLFFRINDSQGNLQIIVKEIHDGKSVNMKDFKSEYKEGDIISVEGIVGKSKTGEISVFAEKILMITTSLNRINIEYKEVTSDLPAVFLLQNKDIIEKLIKRSRLIHACRGKLKSDGFIEVETPILNSIYNGGFSQPYIVKNANRKANQYLRVSSELYLKQLIIGGMNEIFEIGKQFRGGEEENISKPEYTSLEIYKAFKDYFWMMEYIENLFLDISKSVLKTEKVEWLNSEIDLSKNWEKITFRDSFVRYAEIDISSIDEKVLNELFKKHSIVQKDMDSMLLSLFKVLVAPKIINPTFVYNLPASISPFSKRNPESKKEVLKFSGYICGKKIIDGSMEENNRSIIENSIRKQKELKKKMGVKIYPEDKKFLKSLNYGMPPLVGASISIDRMSMLFTNSSNIREINIF
ncbi:MAG: amino acid--tRNA ligase-related protein [Candidatus Dojkabacteria bacterium]|jgi:lysyl-tRNA synthetase class 2|nr:amino acid--tRNA ligase-related protein [Candidatus Dojkabacteria bacterium]